MGEEKIFFLSHSTKDEKTVLEIAERLGRNLCWVYQWEAKAGQSIFQYDKGIADSRIFLLFWSKNANQSPWVKEEIDVLRIRMMNDQGYRPVVIKLDNTPLPVFLQTRININGTLGIFHIINKIREIQKDLTPTETLLGISTLKDFFQDREIDFNKFEELASEEQYGGIVILGFDGIGKTTFVKQAISRIFFRFNPIWIDLKIESTPVRLLSAISRPFGLAIDLGEIGRNPESVWRTKILPEIIAAENSFIVFDNFSMPGRDPTLKGQQITRLLKIICKDIADHKKKENPTIVILSSRIPDEMQNSLQKYAQMPMNTLENKDISRALNYHLSKLTSLKIDSKKIEKLAEKLRGYPLAIIIAANRVVERGIDVVLEDKALLRDMLFQMAEDLFSGIELNDDEKELLITLSTSVNPLNVGQLKQIHGDKWIGIGNLAKKQLLDPSIKEYKLHPILSEYVRRAIASSDKIIETHSKLSDLFEQEWKNAPENSSRAAKYGSLAYYHSISSGQFKEAQKIRLDFLVEAKDAAIELYRLKRYEIALQYLENARKMTELTDPIYDYYYALCLSRIGRDKEALSILIDLANKYPRISRYHHSLGLVYSRLKKTDDALKSFRTSIAMAHTERQKTVPLVSLADLLYQMGNIKEARELIDQALTIDKYNSNVVSVATNILIETGEKSKALAILNEALQFSPTDTHLHHRIGMILKDMGKFDKAIDHLSQATYDPALSYSSIALADIYIKINDLDRAEITLEKFIGNKDRNISYLTTKANILRKKGLFDESNILLQKSIKISQKDAIPYGGLAQLRLDQTNHALSKDQKQEAFIYIAEAKKYVNLGLQIEPKNEGLLSINHAITELMNAIGYK